MKVFLSWSGEKSRAVAKALRDWLPYINPEIDPWMSDADIQSGKRWSGEIAKELEAAKFGIVCVTSENQTAPWLNFEAGAIAKQVDEGRVVPLAIGLKPIEVMQPIGQFQGKEMTKDGLLEVLESLNKLCRNRVADVGKALDQWWPDLDPKLKAASTSTETAPARRDQQDLLEEILGIVRGWRNADLRRILDDAEAAVHRMLGEAQLRGLDLIEALDMAGEASRMLDEARRRELSEARRLPESRGGP